MSGGMGLARAGVLATVLSAALAASTAALAAGAAPPSCPRAIDRNWGWYNLSSQGLASWMSYYRITLVPATARTQDSVTRGELAQFLAEFARVPRPHAERVRATGTEIHLLHGRGVSEDPSWSFAETNTLDGRRFESVPGTGGYPYLNSPGKSLYPARFVSNHLYDHHGSVNLVLHEFAHTLDSVERLHAFSDRPEWRRIVARDARFRRAMSGACGGTRYCLDQPGEAFAEAYALYYSCDASRRWLERQAPEAARFVRNVQ